jgi:hypothetical protein
MQAIQRSNRELWWAFSATILITLVYLYVVITWKQTPPARELFGHSIGILGFVLMLMTEILYTLRKRSRLAQWGRLSTWLQIHIFTGLVGPYMVLLHSSWKFNGLAGITMLLTVVIVASGFIGRYIYTAIPRTADGVEVETDELQRQMAMIQAQVDSQSRLSNPSRQQQREMRALQKRLRTLQRQVSSLAAARRLLSLWHTVHIPIGMALFTAAFIHSAAAIYYATLLR